MPEAGKRRVVGRKVSRRDERPGTQTRGERLHGRARDVRERHLCGGSLFVEYVRPTRIDLDAVCRGIGDRCRHRVLVGIEGDHRRKAELRCDDRQDAGSAAEVDDARGLELEHQLDAQLRRRMGAGAERTARVDHDRGRVCRPVGPGRPDPERPDTDGLVKRLPTIAPVGGDVLPSYASEDVPEPLLAARIRVSDELDSVGALDLFEALWEELEHLRARFLCALGGDGNRNPPDRVQRNALFSLSKNPSPPS